MQNNENIDVLLNAKNNPNSPQVVIFGSFFLGISEFALAIESIQEVVNSPQQYTPMPLAPVYLLGIFNLRDMIVPVINLRKLLHLEDGKESKEANKIAVIKINGAHVGLLFDRTGEVFRDKGENRCDFDYLSSKKTEASVISGAIKLEQGKRIVQLLNPSTLLKLEGVPLPNHQKSHKVTGKRDQSYEGIRQQCISFVVGPCQCAFGIDCISEIIKVQEIKNSVFKNEICLGMITLRGDVVPVIDFARLLEYEPTPLSDTVNMEKRIIVMRLGNEKFGLLVAAVQNIISYYSEELLPVPILSQYKANMFKGCLSKPEAGDVILLAHEHVLSNAEIIEITHCHSKIYETSSAKSLETKTLSQRTTYITFKLNNLFAVGIEETGEIIEYPKVLVHPPGLPAHVKGMFNLRDQMLPIVEARDLYSMEKCNSPAHQKVILFTCKGEKFGLVVDSVENIVSFSEEEKLKLPDNIFQKETTSLNSDIKGAVQISVEGKEKIIIIILNVDFLADRVLGFRSNEEPSMRIA